MKGIITVASLVLVTGSALARPELNAFINKPANSVPELITQIKSDRAVADRFVRHFSMSKEEVIEYFSTLRLGSLQNSGYYTIYSAPENGVLKAHVSFFKKGTPAFVDADGTPVLRVKCANPFVAGKAGITAIKAKVEDVPATEVSAAMDGSMNLKGLEDLSVSAPAIPDTELELPADSNMSLTTDLGSLNSGGGSLNFAPFALGAAATIVSSGGNNPNPVPEPATMLAVGLGAAALLKRRKKS